MIKFIADAYDRYFSDPDTSILFSTILLAIIIFMTLGNILAPVFTAVVLAYLLQWAVDWLKEHRFSHVSAVLITYFTFIGLMIAALLGLLPLLWHQLTTLFTELPNMFKNGQLLLKNLALSYPAYFTIEQMEILLNYAKTAALHGGQSVLSVSLATIPGIATLTIYFVLVPLLVYFFLMDQEKIFNWMRGYLPKRRRLLNQVWLEICEQIGNYVRGRIIEMIIVAIACYLTFAFLRLPYASLLAALVGISVIVPYLGAILVTIPVFLIACLEWGWAPSLAYLAIAYALIIALDANVLMPILFSGIMKLHPISIILAVLVFGGLFGFWGVFFAIPLACVIKAVLNAWPLSS